MNVALGDAGIVLALAASLVAAATLVVAQRKADEQLHRTGVRIAWVVVVGAVLSFVALERALITRDFEVLFVFENGSHRTPALYNFATAWAADGVEVVVGHHGQDGTEDLIGHQCT